MKRPNDIEITAYNPWDGDDLNRRPQGEALHSFLSSIQSSYVIALKAPWGTGKTTFLKRLGFQLEPKIPVIRLDAWRNDFVDDPLLAFVSAVNQRLKAAEGSNKTVAKRLVSDIARLGGKLSGPLLGSLAKALVPGSEVLVSLAEALTKSSDILLAEQEKHEKTVESFKEKLASARDILTGRTADEAIRPIVFLIDELDRCRPDFAIRTLERIKHFFDVPGIIFLIATDGANLPAAVKAVYGIDHDPERYLRKFIDFEFRLTDPTCEQFIKYLCTQFSVEELLGAESPESVFNLMVQNAPEFNQRPSDKSFAMAEVIDAFPIIAEAFNLSLRDQIQAFTIAVASVRAASKSFIIFGRLLVFCAALRYADPQLYEILITGNVTLKALLNNNLTPKSPNIRTAVSSVPSLSVYMHDVAEILERNSSVERADFLRQQISIRKAPERRVLIPLESQSVQMQSTDGYLSKLLFLVNSFEAPSQTVSLTGISSTVHASATLRKRGG